MEEQKQVFVKYKYLNSFKKFFKKLQNFMMHFNTLQLKDLRQE